MSHVQIVVLFVAGGLVLLGWAIFEAVRAPRGCDECDGLGDCDECRPSCEARR